MTKLQKHLVVIEMRYKIMGLELFSIKMHFMNYGILAPASSIS